MKIRHKVNHGWMGSADRVDADYQREVDRMTERGERAYALAAKRVAAAERRLARVVEAKSPVERKRRIRAAAAAVEARRQELRALQRDMTATPAGSQHRGGGSYRAVPSGEVI